MTNLIATFQDRFSDWLTVVAFDLVTSYFYRDSLGCLSSLSSEVGGLGLADCRDFPDHSVSSLVRALYSLDGNWNLACFDSSSDLCDFSDFAKYHHWVEGN